MYVCVHTYIFVYICICTQTYIRVCVCVYMCLRGMHGGPEIAAVMMQRHMALSENLQGVGWKVLLLLSLCKVGEKKKNQKKKSMFWSFSLFFS